MPSNTTYGLETDSLRIRYNPNRNFQKLFEGEGMKPINQDAVVKDLVKCKQIVDKFQPPPDVWRIIPKFEDVMILKA